MAALVYIAGNSKIAQPSKMETQKIASELRFLITFKSRTQNLCRLSKENIFKGLRQV